ncbi:MAG: hypothetical protein SA339_11575 [Methanomassiliicoccus sp.]|nr:hypothetical protein [Methanomassiliicoccus sp.]
MSDEVQGLRAHCLWHAADGRCSNCKARRIRNDVLKMKDYDICEKDRDYEGCEFFVEKPVPKK